MKKVGILSMQRVINYGSFLQAFGLKTLLEEQGHSVQFVDIAPGEQREFPDRELVKIGYKAYTGLRRLAAVLDRYFVKRCIGQLYQKKLVKLLEQKHVEQLGMTEEKVTDIPCDTLVIGSDEVFNCVQPSPWGVSYQLFGDYPHAQRVITYAASSGYAKVEQLPEDIRAQISRCFQKVSAISVRDDNTLRFASALTEQPVQQHLDPVLTADFTPYRKPFHCKKPYLLVYAYTNRINLPEEIEAIRAFARKHGLKTAAVGGYQCWCDYNFLVEPLQIFDVFAGAAYVVTDTFHGTVIAAKMNRPFATILRSSNYNKLGDLISRLHMEQRTVPEIGMLEEVLLRPVEFDELNEMLARERVRTREYLTQWV